MRDAVQSKQGPQAVPPPQRCLETVESFLKCLFSNFHLFEKVSERGRGVSACWFLAQVAAQPGWAPSGALRWAAGADPQRDPRRPDGTQLSPAPA